MDQIRIEDLFIFHYRSRLASTERKELEVVTDPIGGCMWYEVSVNNAVIYKVFSLPTAIKLYNEE